MVTSAPVTSDSDIVVVGGGMVGLTQALLLACQLPSARITLVESQPMVSQPQAMLQPSFDGRSTALSAATVDVLSRLGIWSSLEPVAQPINRVHVSDRGHIGQTDYSREDNGGLALGYVIENRFFGSELITACHRQPQLTVEAPSVVEQVALVRGGVELKLSREGKVCLLRAGLVVIADGAESPLRRQLGVAADCHDYRQAAVIANVAFSEAHNGQAFERFTPDGPLAVLPLAGERRELPSRRAALVWTRPQDMLAETLAWSNEAFLGQLQSQFGYRLGRCLRVGERASYPLKMVFAREQIRRGIVFMGNAAHFLHPVAGQGFNLALRDCTQLASVLAAAWRKGEPLGSLAVLQRYLHQQNTDQLLTSQLSHQFIQVFASRHPGWQLARNAGLLGLSILPGLKQEFFQQMMGQSLPRAEFFPSVKREQA